MNFHSKHTMPPAASDETVFRIAIWGPLFAFMLFLLALIGGVVFFINSYQASFTWGMILSGLYVLLMWFICQMLLRVVTAVRSPANWIVRIGPRGVLLKYRSYLHDDSPAEDSVAMQLAWSDIVDARLQQERYTTTDVDSSKTEVRRWFLIIKLNPRYCDIDRVKSAIEFETQRKPAHMKVDELKHELFQARKNRAPDSEIARIKQLINQENQRHPGKHHKARFNDRPVLFINPDQLKIQWSHVTPGKKSLRQLLAHYTTMMEDEQQSLDITEPLTESEFQSLLTDLLRRDNTIEAIKLVRLQLGLSLTDAKAYIENNR